MTDTDRAARVLVVEDDADIAQARSVMGWKRIQRAPGRLFLPVDRMMLDFGGVGKELAVDFLKEMAIAKGLPRRRVITRHVLRNSLIPVVTFIGADVGALMGGAIVTERIFNIHGVGFQLYQGILRQNTQTVVGFVTILVLVFLAVNLIVDLLYAVLDPRIRYA